MRSSYMAMVIFSGRARRRARPAEVGSTNRWRASNDSPRAPPRCGGAPAAARTRPEHAPDMPDTGGHCPGQPGRALGAGAMSSSSTTTRSRPTSLSRLLITPISF